MEKPGLRAAKLHSVQKNLETTEGIRINRRNIHRLWSLGPKNPFVLDDNSSYNIRINRNNFEKTKEFKLIRDQKIAV